VVWGAVDVIPPGHPFGSVIRPLGKRDSVRMGSDDCKRPSPNSIRNGHWMGRVETARTERCIVVVPSDNRIVSTACPMGLSKLTNFNMLYPFPRKTTPYAMGLSIGLEAPVSSADGACSECAGSATTFPRWFRLRIICLQERGSFADCPAPVLP